MWRSDVAPRTKCKVVTPSQLAKIYAPKKFPKGLISRNAWVFEYDPDYITKTNPHAVGKDFGIVNDPYGRNPEVAWSNGQCDGIQRKYLRQSVQPNETFTHAGFSYCCLKYSSKGVHLLKKRLAKKSQREYIDDAPPPAKRTRNSRNPKSPAKETAKNTARKKQTAGTTPKSPAKETAKNTAQKKQTTVDADWIRCRAKPLSARQMNKLSSLVGEALARDASTKSNEWTSGGVRQPSLQGVHQPAEKSSAPQPA